MSEVPPEVKFSKSKHGEGKLLSNFFLLSVHWGDLIEQKKKIVIYTLSFETHVALFSTCTPVANLLLCGLTTGNFTCSIKGKIKHIQP